MKTPEKKPRPVAITGMGIVASTGEGVKPFGEALIQGKSFYSTLTYPELSFPVVCAPLSDFIFSHSLQKLKYLSSDHSKLLIKLVRQTPLTIQASLIAALETWHQAQADVTPFESDNIGLIVAGQNTTSNYQYNLFNTFQNQPDYLLPSYALHFMDTDHVGVLSEALGIKGEGYTVGGASASGNIALLRAYQSIIQGSMDACLVVGTLAELSPMELQAFHNLGAMGGQSFNPNKACRPFDQNHEGFIPGQAAACILLESITSAQNRHVPILAYMLGGAIKLDANHLSDPSAEGEQNVMQRSIDTAGITINDINYINTHGTSSALGDTIEIEAIESFLGTHINNVFLNSTKSITGHCLWSAGVVEAIATIIQIQEKFLHPSLNLENPISKNSQFVTDKSKPYSIQFALSNSFGFGGINTALVFSKKS